VKTDEIRARFLEYFRQRDHVVEKSDRLVPSNDPTLLFTSAGMVQFKPYYTGEVPVPYRRATTAQKCLRAGGKANDLDEVGKTSRHLTFFEMLGNFSFGDYFKREAIEWAWDFTTRELGISPERIWVSVYEEDDEARDIWVNQIGIPEDRVVRLGAKDNFWGPAGDTGACGPCSELLLDRGKDIDPTATPERDPKERFIEFWNLVFPQYDQQPDGSRPPLKNRGIDTGMGLERMAALLQGVETVFDTDGLLPIIRATESLTKTPYEENRVPYRVIADHVRALSFMIADGIMPSNEGRGYVFRRLLRRAARFGREIGLEEPFLFRVCHAVVDRMNHQYPELKEREKQIERVILVEEQRFQSTLARGMEFLFNLFQRLGDEKKVPGEELFRLHDTYGFPLDLATDIATDRGLLVDKEGFEAAMERQREQARRAWAGSGEETINPIYRVLHSQLGDTEFVGYQVTESKGKVLAIIREDKQVDCLDEGQEGEVILDRTPFYAESGGQVGDVGVLETPEGDAKVSTTRRKCGKMTLHVARVVSGRLRKGAEVTAVVDKDARECTQNHHTATHLLHAALRTVLGDHVHQAGSLVSPERLRFDFTHFEAIPWERLRDIERMVNQYIRTDSVVETRILPIEEARAAGAMALFDEKYESLVRVVKIDDISMELCGGTHVSRTGVIGCFLITGESAISAGVRRIEAVCGEPAIEFLQSREKELVACARALNSPVDELEVRLKALQEENRKLAREVAKWKQSAVLGASTNHMQNAVEVAGVKVLALQLDGQDMEALRMAADRFRDKLGTGVVVLGSSDSNKVSLCVAVTKDLSTRISAGAIVKELAPIVGGGGGGRPDFAQAGGKNPEKLPDAIACAPEVVRKLLK